MASGRIQPSGALVGALAALLVTAALPSPAYAQGAPPPAPGAPPAPPPDAASGAPGAPGAPPPPRLADDPAVDARYEFAMRELAAGRLREAADALDEVAAMTRDPQRRTTAIELASQLRRQLPPGAPGRGADATSAGGRSRDGRYTLVGTVTALGLGLYGPTLPIVASVDNDRMNVGLYLLGAGAPVVAAYLVTADQPVSWAVADAWTYGATRGAVHGLALAALTSDDLEGRGTFASLSLGSLAEGAAFAAWAHKTGASPGLTNTMGKVADLGAAYGLGAAALIGGDEVDHNALLGSLLVGSAVGYGAGYWYGRRRDLTWGDAEVQRTATYYGALAGLAPLIVAEVDSFRPYVASAMLTSAAGFIIADRLLEGRDFTPGQGAAVGLATQAGAVVGAGLGYILAPGEDGDQAKTAIVGAVLGAAAGFGATFFRMDTRPRPARGDAPGAAPRMTMQVTPTISPEQRGLALAGTF